MEYAIGMVQHRFVPRIAKGCKRLHLKSLAIRHHTLTTCRSILPTFSLRLCIAKAAHDSSPAELAAEVPVPSQNAKTEELDEKERLRRQRISLANSGKVAWNKGRKHSPETIAKIRERTKQAMLRDEVVEKVKEGRARQLSQPVNQGIKERIRSTLLAYHAAKRLGDTSASEGSDDGSLAPEVVGAAPNSEMVAAKSKRRQSSKSLQPSTPVNTPEEKAVVHEVDTHTGDPTDDGKQATQPAKSKFRAAAVAARSANADHDAQTPLAPPPVLPRPKRRPAATSDSDIPAVAPLATAAAGEGAGEVKAPERRPGPPHGVKRSPEHRAAIAEAIRRKWQDPTYRASAIAGIRRAAGSDTGARAGGAARRHQAGNRAKLPERGLGAGINAASVSGETGTEAGSRRGKARKSNVSEEELPLTVRSSRVGRAGTRGGGMHKSQDGAVHSPSSTNSTNGNRGGVSVGNDEDSSDSSDTATSASSGGLPAGGGSSHSVSPAARLAHVQRLVRQVLVAERLVANTENLLRQFTQRRHALRNDPVIRSQADEQLRSVTATLQQAKGKLELLRAKVPPDARYNEKGDVWFAPHVPASSSGPQASRPPRAATGAGSGSGKAAGSSWGGIAHEEETGDNRGTEDGVAGRRSSNSSTSSGSGGSWPGGFTWQGSGNGNGNGKGKGLVVPATVVDVEGSGVDTNVGADPSGKVGVTEYWGSNATNTVALSGNGAHSDRWQSDYQHHVHSCSRERSGSGKGNGNNATSGLKGPANSDGLNGDTVPLDPYNERYYTDLDEEGEDEDEGEDDEDGFWWNSGWGHSPPSGHSPTGPGGLGTFADLPPLDSGENIQVDLISLDPLNTLLLRPVNGHTAPHPGAAIRHTNSTMAGLEPELPCDSIAEARGKDDAGGSSGIAAAAATADPLPSAGSRETTSSQRGGSSYAGLGVDWLVVHEDGDGGAAPSSSGLQENLRSANALNLAVWLGNSQGRTLRELQALVPESHAWLKVLLTRHAEVTISSLQAAGLADAAKQEFDWITRLQEQLAPGSHAGHDILPPATGCSARVVERMQSDTATPLGQDPRLQGDVGPTAGPMPNMLSVAGDVDNAWMASGAGRRVVAEQQLQLQEEKAQEWNQEQQSCSTRESSAPIESLTRTGMFRQV